MTFVHDVHIILNMNTITVTFGNFRDNLSDYFELMKNGNRVSIKDGRKDENIITLFAKEEEKFDWDEHMKWMKSFKPIFTNRDVAEIKKARNATNKRLKKLNW